MRLHYMAKRYFFNSLPKDIDAVRYGPGLDRGKIMQLILI